MNLFFDNRVKVKNETLYFPYLTDFYNKSFNSYLNSVVKEYDNDKKQEVFSSPPFIETRATTEDFNDFELKNKYKTNRCE